MGYAFFIQIYRQKDDEIQNFRFRDHLETGKISSHCRIFIQISRENRSGF